MSNLDTTITQLQNEVARLKKQAERAEIAGAMIRRTYAELYDTSVAPLTDRWKDGMFAFCRDGRKTGETAGNGTGCPVYFDTDTVQWLRFSDDSVVAI